MPPPLPNAVAVLLGAALDRLWRWPVAQPEVVQPVGVVVLSIAGVLIVTALLAFRRHRTTLSVYHETKAIIDTGPFRFTRNPSYLTLQIFQVALALLYNNAWILLLTLPAAMVVHYVVILGEEAYLERKFGDAYLDYKSRVRRWI